MGTTVWNGMLGLLLPRGCAGCDKPDEVLCPDCQALFRKQVTLPLGGTATEMSTETGSETVASTAATNTTTITATTATTSAVTITAGGIYQGRVRRAILSWKDHGDVECDKAFSRICRELATSSMAKSGAFNAGVLNAGAGGVSAVDGAASMGVTTMNATANATPPQILVIPAPSSPQSMRARGRQHLWPLAKAVASELAAGGAESCAVNALGISRVHGKAVETTNARGRAARLKERLEVPDPGLIAGKNVLILDDIVTTGTTMRRCAEAVRGAGGHVIGGIALAAVPPPDELQEDTPC